MHAPLASRRLSLSLVAVLAAVLVAVLVAVTALVALPRPAAAASPTYAATGTPDGDGYGYNNVIGTTPIYNHYMVVGSTKVIVYCLNQNLTYDASGTYHAVAPDTTSIPNVQLADDIAANATNLGTPLTPLQSEAVAIQAAIWDETGNFNFYTIPNAAITTRVQQLVQGVSPLAPTNLGAHLTLTRTSTAVGTYLHGILRQSSGAPFAYQSVTIVAGNRHFATITSARGAFATPLLKGREKVRATWTGTLPAGTIFSNGQSADQDLVTADPATITTSATLFVSPTSHPVTTTTVHSTPTTGVTATTVPHVTTTTHAPVHHHTTPTTHPTTTTTLPSTSTTLLTTPTTLPVATKKSGSALWYFVILIVAIIAALLWWERKSRTE